MKQHIKGVLANVNNGPDESTTMVLDNVVAVVVLSKIDETTRAIEVRVSTRGLEEADVLHLEQGLREAASYMRDSPSFELAKDQFLKRYGRPFSTETIHTDGEFRPFRKDEVQ